MPQFLIHEMQVVVGVDGGELCSYEEDVFVSDEDGFYFGEFFYFLLLLIGFFAHVC